MDNSQKDIKMTYVIVYLPCMAAFIKRYILVILEERNYRYTTTYHVSRDVY